MDQLSKTARNVVITRTKISTLPFFTYFAYEKLDIEVI